MVTTHDEIMTMDEVTEYLKMSKSILHKLARANKSSSQRGRL